MRKISHFFFLWVGFSALYGRSSCYVLQSGLCFVAVSCLHLIADFYPTFFRSYSLTPQIISGVIQILDIVQMEYHAKLVADSDAATGMTSIAFQERMQISTGSGV
ncbi:uncharacterized protein F5891DRAFT_1010097 [Suillus fuscotomentosus]|uniref:Uncharacterized protein n=1 Tax=Suillus fuscotomentosus TaxID=1912939 RepID=A0AAD4HQ90_9AGAM|nr:uncharacterized protein F5891DRAFT_1010097 [Suillus fuscotomentosus]KAG1905008.1 hypothetical protein F5891DRAFT_1010097 [Suillus fuscotomentosus]